MITTRRAERQLEELRGDIDQYGWALQYVEDDDSSCCYAYTAGLALRDLPELFVTGLPPQESWDVLNDVAGRATAGRPPAVGDVLADVVPGISVLVEALPDPRYLARACDVMGELVRAHRLRVVELPAPAL